MKCNGVKMCTNLSMGERFNTPRNNGYESMDELGINKDSLDSYKQHSITLVFFSLCMIMASFYRPSTNLIKKWFQWERGGHLGVVSHA
jgi:hypothetical protein